MPTVERFERLGLRWPTAIVGGRPSIRSAAGRLSERDIALLRLLAAGHSNKEISAALGLAESTIKNQLGALFDRLGVNDRTQAALYAFSHGILVSDQPGLMPTPARDERN